MKKVKVTTVGNSAGIVLTADMLEKLGVAKGDEVCVTETPYGLNVTAYDAAFRAQMDVFEDLMREKKDVLRELAKR